MNYSSLKQGTRWRMMVWVIGATIFSSTPISSQWSDWIAPPEANDQKNPLIGDPSAVQQGKALFSAICFVCHGSEGKGDGINAPSLAKQPADLTSWRVQQQSDGALFWKISEGNPPMLSFKGVLSEAQRWQMVAFIRDLAKSSSGDITAVDQTANGISSKNNEKNKISVNSDSQEIVKENADISNPYKDIESGRDLFKFICGACHTIGKGKLVGPDLKNVNRRHSRPWLLKWVRSSQDLVKAGDAEAVAVYEENNKVIMPDQPFLSSSQVNKVFDYIQEQSNPQLVSIGGGRPSGKVRKAPRIYQPASLGMAGYVLIGGLFFFVGVLFYIVIVLSRMVV